MSTTEDRAHKRVQISSHSEALEDDVPEQFGRDADGMSSTKDDQDEGGEDDPEEEEMAYEAQRLETIRQNNALLDSLGLGKIPNPVEITAAPIAKHNPGRVPVKRPVRAKPLIIYELRRSSRVAAKQDEDAAAQVEREKFQELPSDWRDDQMRRGKGGVLVLPKGERVSVPSIRYQAEPESARPLKRRKVAPGAPIGDGEVSLIEPEDYSVVHPKPSRMTDGSGRLVFGGRWKGVFEPNVTPEEMFVGGAFGGSYYADNYSLVLKEPLNGQMDIQELPPSLLTTIPKSTLPGLPSRKYSPSTHLTSPQKDPTINRFGVSAGQTLQDWEKSGWIWTGDPRGWAQWYLRFWMGRRCEDDERQVHRWLNLAGPNGRFSRALLKKIANGPGSGGLSVKNLAVMDESVGTVMRQVCWQWGYEVNEAEWKRKIG